MRARSAGFWVLQYLLWCVVLVASVAAYLFGMVRLQPFRYVGF